jgi:lysophospholipase L1-like esterase
MMTRHLKTYLLSTLMLLLWLLGVAMASIGGRPSVSPLLGLCLPLAVKLLWWVSGVGCRVSEILRSYLARGPPFLRRALAAFALLLLSVQAQAANIWSANWDALSTGVTWTTSTPSGWSLLSIGGQLTQETYAGLAGSPATQSSPNVLRFNAGTGITGYIWRATGDGNGGDVSQTAKVWFQSGLGANTSDSVGLMVRIGNGSGTGGTPTLSGISEYIGRITGNGLLLDRQTTNTITNIQTVGSSSTFATGIWYVLKVTSVGTTVSVQVQRLSDSQYLNASAAWQAGQVNAISVTDANVVGAGFGGLKLGADGSGMVAYIDDVSFDTSAATTPATGITLNGPSTGHLNQATSNFTIALDPALGTTTGDVTVTPATDLSGTFTPTTRVLNTATQSATFTFTPSVTGTHSVTITNNGSLSNPSAVSVTVTKPPVTVGVLSVSPTTASNTSVAVVSTAPAGGTNQGFTYSWQLGTSPTGSFSTVGTNSLTLTLSIAQMGSPGLIKYVKLTYTDDDSPTPNTATTEPFPVSLWDAPIVVGIAGDSNFAEALQGILNSPSGVNNNGTGSVGGRLGGIIQSQIGLRYIPSTANVTVGQVAGLSQARTGTTMSGWDPTGASHYVSDSYTNIWQPAGVTHIILMLGTNDAIAQNASKAAYKTALENVVSYLTTRGIKVSILKPFQPNLELYKAANPGDSGLWTYAAIRTAIGRIAEYWEAIDEVIAASNSSQVKLCDAKLPEKFAGYPSLFSSDGIHVNTAGSAVLEDAVAKAFIVNWFVPATGGAVRPPIGGGPVRRNSSLRRQDLSKGRALAWRR